MTERPNIVLLVLDTLRAKNVSCYGHDRETTPFIDSLAEEGARYENAYTVSPWTLPAHASLFTGTYPSEHQANAATKHLSDDLPTVAEELRGSGYATVSVSNNIWLTAERGMDRGFDDFKLAWQLFDTPDVASPTTGDNRSREVYAKVAKKVLRGNIPKRVANLFYGLWFRGRRDRAEITNRKILKGLPDEPFFLFANYMEPHMPYRPPEEYAERFLPDDVSFEEADDLPQNPWDYVFGDQEYDEQDFEILEALYDAAIAYLDDQVRALVEELEERTDRDTVFIVTSDHGENIGDHGLMAHQYSLEKTVMHIPLVIAGESFSGTVEEQASLIDVHRTILERAGIEAEEDGRGRDLRQPVEQARCFAQYHDPTPPPDILKERYGIGDEAFNGRTSMDAVIDDDRKLIRFADRNELRSNDGSEERVNDAEKEDDLVAALVDWEAGLMETDGATEAAIDETLKRRLEELGYY